MSGVESRTNFPVSWRNLSHYFTSLGHICWPVEGMLSHSRPLYLNVQIFLEIAYFESWKASSQTIFGEGGDPSLTKLHLEFAYCAYSYCTSSRQKNLEAVAFPAFPHATPQAKQRSMNCNVTLVSHPDYFVFRPLFRALLGSYRHAMPWVRVLILIFHVRPNQLMFQMWCCLFDLLGNREP